MADLASMDELNERIMQNLRITGFGVDTTQHVPCPFCGTPDWTEWKIADPRLYEVMQEERKCAACGRSGKQVINRTSGGITARLVQTGGPWPPSWWQAAYGSTAVAHLKTGDMGPQSNTDDPAD